MINESLSVWINVIKCYILHCINLVLTITSNRNFKMCVYYLTNGLIFYFWDIQKGKRYLHVLKIMVCLGVSLACKNDSKRFWEACRKPVRRLFFKFKVWKINLCVIVVLIGILFWFKTVNSINNQYYFAFISCHLQFLLVSQLQPSRKEYSQLIVLHFNSLVQIKNSLNKV